MQLHCTARIGKWSLKFTNPERRFWKRCVGMQQLRDPGSDGRTGRENQANTGSRVACASQRNPRSQSRNGSSVELAGESEYRVGRSYPAVAEGDLMAVDTLLQAAGECNELT